MAICIGENNALLLKNDRSVAEFYKGNTKIFGYNDLKQGDIIIADNVHPVEHKLKIKLSSDSVTDFSAINVTRCGKNFFDADTVLPSLRNPSFPASSQRWVKQEDGSFYLFNSGILHNYDWFNNTENYTGQMAISITGKCPNATEGDLVFGVRIYYTDGTYGTIWMNYSGEFETKTLVSNASKTILRIGQVYSIAKGVYVKDVMIAYGNDAEYEPYNPQTVTANADGTVEGLTSLPKMVLSSDSEDMNITCKYVALI